MPETKTIRSLRDAQLRHEALHRGQDRVVPAAGAPADLLVGLEVLGGQLHRQPVQTFLTTSSSMVSSSPDVNGRPRTWLYGMASTR